MTAAPAPDPSFRSAPADEAVPLASLRLGSRAVVARVDREQALGRRLLDLGFIPGTTVQVMRQAPLGDPVVYELRGTRLCLRRADAAHVWVHPLPGDVA